MNKRLLVTFVLLFSLVPNLRGQQSPQPTAPSPSPLRTPAAPQQGQPRDGDQDVVRITTNLVQVDAVVTKDGKQVTDLKAEDFEIFEDGKAQTITQLSYVSNVPAVSSSLPNTAATAQPGDKKGPPVVPTTARPNEVRRTVALVVDDLGLSAESIVNVRRQVRKFLDEQVQPNDLVSILQTGGSEVGALQQFTTDKRLLNSALEHLRWNPCSRGGSNVFRPVRPGPDDRPYCSFDTVKRTLRVLRFVLQGMRELPGRKSMVVFSDDLPIEEQDEPKLGVEELRAGLPNVENFKPDGGTSEQTDPKTVAKMANPGASDSGDSRTAGTSLIALLQKIAELAIRASVVIYAVDTRGLQYTGPTAADSIPGPSVRSSQTQINSVLNGRSLALVIGREGGALIAQETGGFLVSNSNDFNLQRVMDDQSGYYLIGYRPHDETFNRRFHHINVRVKGRGLTVRTRKGFYGVAQDEETPSELTTRDKLNKALMSPFGADDVKVRLTTIFASHPTKGSLLRSLIFLDARDLVFKDSPDGAHEATLDLSSIIFGDYGVVVSRQDETVKLRLNPARYDRVLREGVVYRFDTPVKQSGSFQFRVALHDTASSRIGAAGQFIEVPNLGNDRLALSGILVGGAGRADDLSQGPAVRRFQAGSPVTVSYAVYNARLDKNTHLPQLRTQTHIYRDGKVVYTGKAAPLDVTGQSDLQRIAATAQLELDSKLSPGEYALLVTVDDLLAKDKQVAASQWIDFAVVK